MTATERLRAHPLRLTRYDRAMLFGGGELSFRPGSAPASDLDYKTAEKKQRCRYGAIRATARRCLDGEFKGMSGPEIAQQEGVNAESLRAAIWKMKNDAKRSTKRRAAA